MTGYLLIAATIVCLSLLVALMALSLAVADWLERRQCTCLFEPQAAIGFAVDKDGSEWVLYPRCRMHGRQQRTRIAGNAKTAIADQAIAVISRA